MSKFNYNSFSGGFDSMAFNKEKYSKEKAIEKAIEEHFELYTKGYLAIGSAYVRHRAGINEDNEPCVGWWLEYEEYKRSCPCWVVHWAKTKDERFSKDYEYIELNK